MLLDERSKRAFVADQKVAQIRAEQARICARLEELAADLPEWELAAERAHAELDVVLAEIRSRGL